REKALLQTASECDPNATLAGPRELLRESLLLQEAAVKNASGPRVAEPGTRLRRDAAGYRHSLANNVERPCAIASSDERVGRPSPRCAQLTLDRGRCPHAPVDFSLSNSR